MKTKVAIIFGGDSFEHEISKMTAESILQNIDRDLFDVVEVYIARNGKFDERLLDNIDVAFIAMHGPNCEDGKFQKYLEDRGIKYTGPSVEASRINMDKVEMHEVHKAAGLPVVENKGFRKGQEKEAAEYCQKIGYPIFVKPNNTGSSVGISKVKSESELSEALDAAFECDENICIEKGILNHREYEVAILGNEIDLIVTNPGEVLANGEFYSYETKYIKPFDTTTAVSDMKMEKVEEIKVLAKLAYTSTGCKGYARIDFLADGDGKIYISEVSTLPGFTKISMFPKLMLAEGFSYKDLITRIIELTME